MQGGVAGYGDGGTGVMADKVVNRAAVYDSTVGGQRGGAHGHRAILVIINGAAVVAPVLDGVAIECRVRLRSWCRGCDRAPVIIAQYCC